MKCPCSPIYRPRPKISLRSELTDGIVDPALRHLLDLLEGQSLAIVSHGENISLGVSQPHDPVVFVLLLEAEIAHTQPDLPVEIHVTCVVEEPLDPGDLAGEYSFEVVEPLDAWGAILVAEDAEVHVGLLQGHHALVATPEILGSLHHQLPVVIVLTIHGRDHLAAVADVSGAAVHQGQMRAALVAVGGVPPDTVGGRSSLLAGRARAILVQLDPSFLPKDGHQLGEGAADLQPGLVVLADLALREELLKVGLVLGNSLHARHGLAVQGELLEVASEQSVALHHVRLAGFWKESS